MLQSEFEAKVGMHVSCGEYEHIIAMYNNCDVNKDEFCSLWIKMNKERVKYAKAIQKKKAERQTLVEKLWRIYDKLIAIPFKDAYILADRKLSERNMNTIAKTGIRTENVSIIDLRYDLEQYLHHQS